jgi:hypothetical protein
VSFQALARSCQFFENIIIRGGAVIKNRSVYISLGIVGFAFKGFDSSFSTGRHF